MKPCSQNKPFCRQRNINANQPIIIPLRGPKTCNLVRKCLLLQSKCNKISYHWLAVDAVLRNLLQQQFPYTWPDYSIPYLGIYFTRSTKSLFLHNYLPLRAKIQADLHNMAKHDLVGQTSCIQNDSTPANPLPFQNSPHPYTCQLL